MTEIPIIATATAWLNETDPDTCTVGELAAFGIVAELVAELIDAAGVVPLSVLEQTRRQINDGDTYRWTRGGVVDRLEIDRVRWNGVADTRMYVTDGTCPASRESIRLSDLRELIELGALELETVTPIGGAFVIAGGGDA